MTFTASPRTNHFHGAYGCNGLNHSDVGLAGFCDDCGAHVFQATKGQLTDIGRNTNGAEVFQCWRAHHCDPRFLAERNVRDAEALVAGRFPKTVKVEVFKGRKVPVGTVGTVKWIGEGFNPGDVKLGLAVEGQTKLVYVDSKNCRVSPEILTAAQATVDADKAMREEWAARMEALGEEFQRLTLEEYRLDDAFDGPKEAWKAYRAEKLTPLRDRQVEILAEIEALKVERGY